MESVFKSIDGVLIVNTFRDDHPGCNFAMEGDELVVVREHWNHNDANAVLFKLQDGLHVGHISKHLAAHLSPLMGKGSIRLKAEVDEVFENNHGDYSVTIELSVISINLPAEERTALSNEIDELRRRGII